MQKAQKRRIQRMAAEPTLYIGAGEFKAKCLGLMELVKEQKQEIVITKHGQPVAKLVPFQDKMPDLRGFLKDSVKITGDIVHSPAIPWNADA
jgi:prevent-host-death family protein